MIRDVLDEAVAAGARRGPACEVLGISARTMKRWGDGAGQDQRRQPKMPPANKLSTKERSEVLRLLVEPRFRDLSPNQIVPLLADEQRFVASESTMYWLLREEGLLKHRGRCKAPSRRPPRAHVATGANQVWSWDITYLRSPVRGVFFYLYLIVDVWSRKVVGWAVHDVESAELAATLFRRTCDSADVDARGLVLHADNGGPMKGSTMVATLERLGVLMSFSRPHVSDDNPYSEALFRTLKYRPAYPTKPFVDVAAATVWVSAFVGWYNTKHLHSGIRFVTPSDRHEGRDTAILAQRHQVYEAARERNKNRWSGDTRNWTTIGAVHLNPEQPAHQMPPQAFSSPASGPVPA